MSAGIDSVLQAAVEGGVVPQVVAMAADADGPIYEGAAGPRAAGESETVTPDTLFRIASMTKMVCTVAALQQVERGNLDLDAPVEQYRPEFADLQVLEGFDGDTPRLRAPASKATVRQLASHTSGLSYWFWNADIVRFEELTGTTNALAGQRAMFTLPLVGDPGTFFEYGINTDWLGLVVEAAGGQTLDAYFAEHILGPLGMTQTTFLMSPEQRANSVPVHLRGESGAWEATELDWSQEPEWFAGGHGLYATPRDYLKFQRMLLGGGTLDGTKIVETASLDEAFSNQIGELDFPPAIATADPGSSADFNAGPGYKFGLGLLLNSEDQPGARAAGSGAWAGIFNSHFWVDRTSGVTGAIYSQTLPFVEPPVFQMYADFERALYASLEQGTVRSGRFARAETPAEVPRDLGPRHVLQPHAALRDELAVVARDVTRPQLAGPPLVDRPGDHVEAPLAVGAQEVGVVGEADRELPARVGGRRGADAARGLDRRRVDAAVDHAPRGVVARAGVDVAAHLVGRDVIDHEPGALDERAGGVERRVGREEAIRRKAIVEASMATTSGRERILETAYELFSRYGTKAVGVDRIIAESGAAKMTLYRNFASKDELILAFLERREERWTRAWLQSEVEARADTRRRQAAGDLRRVRRVVPAGGLRGLLVHQRHARGHRLRAPGAPGERRAPDARSAASSPSSPSRRASPPRTPTPSRASGTSS